jgi:hypothetical protein
VTSADQQPALPPDLFEALVALSRSFLEPDEHNEEVEREPARTSTAGNQ